MKIEMKKIKAVLWSLCGECGGRIEEGEECLWSRGQDSGSSNLYCLKCKGDEASGEETSERRAHKIKVIVDSVCSECNGDLPRGKECYWDGEGNLYCLTCGASFKEIDEPEKTNEPKWPAPGSETFVITETTEKGHYETCKVCGGKGRVTPIFQDYDLSPVRCPECNGNAQTWVAGTKTIRAVKSYFIYGTMKMECWEMETRDDVLYSKWIPNEHNTSWLFDPYRCKGDNYHKIPQSEFKKSHFASKEEAEAEIARREDGESAPPKEEEAPPIPKDTETIYDFKDGNGPVPAHQHPNGGGWVADTATVAETAYVCGTAKVYGNANVYGTAKVYGKARVYGNARVYGTARIYGDAYVCGNARLQVGVVYGEAGITRSPIQFVCDDYFVIVTDKLCVTKDYSASIEDWIRERTEKELKETAGPLYKVLVAILESSL